MSFLKNTYYWVFIILLRLEAQIIEAETTYAENQKIKQRFLKFAILKKKEERVLENDSKTSMSKMHQE